MSQYKQMINQLIAAREELLQRVEQQYLQRFINLFQLKTIITMEIVKQFQQQIERVHNIQNNLDHPLHSLNVSFNNIGFITNNRYILWYILWNIGFITNALYIAKESNVKNL